MCAVAVAVAEVGVEEGVVLINNELTLCDTNKPLLNLRPATGPDPDPDPAGSFPSPDPDDSPELVRPWIELVGVGCKDDTGVRVESPGRRRERAREVC